MVEPDPWANLGLFAIFAGLAAFSAAAQAAMFYMSRSRLRQLLQQGAGRDQAVSRVMQDPANVLSTIVVLHTLALAGCTAVAGLAAMYLWALSPWGGFMAGLAALALLLLLQSLARSLAVYRPERVGSWLLRPARFFAVLLWPFIAPIKFLESLILKWLRYPKQPPSVADEELETIMEAVQGQEDIQEERREMIHGVIELGERAVREIMVPRIDVVALPSTATFPEALERVISSGHSRIPVYRDTIDNVVGVLFAKDLLKHVSGSTDMAGHDSVVETLRRAHFVPESKRIDDLLREMRQEKTHMAVVVDEYGGTAGLVTLEDILEEIVGEVRDEYDVEDERMERLSDTEAIFDARMNIREVEEALSVDLAAEFPEHEFDSLGGLVYDHLGRVPRTGDEVRINSCVISVLSTEGHRIRKVKVQVHPSRASAPQIQ